MSGVATSSRIATPGPTDPTSPSKPNGPPETVKNITATRPPTAAPGVTSRVRVVVRATPDDCDERGDDATASDPRSDNLHCDLARESPGVISVGRCLRC